MRKWGKIKDKTVYNNRELLWEKSRGNEKKSLNCHIIFFIRANESNTSYSLAHCLALGQNGSFSSFCFHENVTNGFLVIFFTEKLGTSEVRNGRNLKILMKNLKIGKVGQNGSLPSIKMSSIDSS